MSASTTVRILRALAISAVAVAFSAGSAAAQIYVIHEADGSRRFTNEPVPGAELFLETRYSLRAATTKGRGPVPFQREISEASIRTGVDARLVEAVIAAESAFDPRAQSSKGAQGLMQLMPDTATRFGVANVWDPMENIVGGTTFLRQLIDTFDGNLHYVLAAYNAGEGTVARYNGVPPFAETRQYIARVLEYYEGVGGPAFAGLR